MLEVYESDYGVFACACVFFLILTLHQPWRDGLTGPQLQQKSGLVGSRSGQREFFISTVGNFFRSIFLSKKSSLGD